MYLYHTHSIVYFHMVWAPDQPSLEPSRFFDWPAGNPIIATEVVYPQQTLYFATISNIYSVRTVTGSEIKTLISVTRNVGGMCNICVSVRTTVHLDSALFSNVEYITPFDMHGQMAKQHS